MDQTVENELVSAISELYRMIGYKASVYVGKEDGVHSFELFNRHNEESKIKKIPTDRLALSAMNLILSIPMCSIFKIRTNPDFARQTMNKLYDFYRAVHAALDGELDCFSGF